MLMRIAPALAFALLGAACSADDSKSQATAENSEPTASAPAATPAPTELVITDLTEGQGDGVQAGQTAVVHYTGWLFDPTASENKGQKFDSSLDRGRPHRLSLDGSELVTQLGHALLELAGASLLACS